MIDAAISYGNENNKIKKFIFSLEVKTVLGYPIVPVEEIDE